MASNEAGRRLERWHPELRRIDRESGRSEDARFDHASEAAQSNALVGQITELKPLMKRAEERIAEIDAEFSTVQGDWAARLTSCGLPALSLEDYPDWFERREQAVLALVEGRSKEERRETLSVQRDAALTSLIEAIDASGLDGVDTDNRSLSGLIAALDNKRGALAQIAGQGKANKQQAKQLRETIDAAGKALELAPIEAFGCAGSVGDSAYGRRTWARQ